MSELDDLIRALDEDADPAHLDMTPAVDALAEIGEPAIPALLGPLAADAEMTRLHAQRALEHIVYRRHGFEPGRGFPDAAAEHGAVADLRAIGYAYDAAPDARAAALERLRAPTERA